MSIPARIGPYAIVRPLGAGGMAETFVAERRGPGAFVQRVCLKRIRADQASDPELVRQFMAEAALAARLRHATIASVLDFGEDRGVLYMALELIDGVDLRELIRRTPEGLPSAVVVYIAVELCTALDVAHGAEGGGIVHRDVSPSNVLVSTEGEVKLADFGIARAELAPSHTRTGIVRGKVPYMAPEYARTARLDARADLFSLGVLLHECAYGVRPFDGATDLETLERATRGERITPPARGEPLPDGFEAILSHLLAPDPGERFAGAGAALEALLSLPSDPRARRELGSRVSAARPAVESTPTDPFATTASERASIASDATTRTLESAAGLSSLPRRKRGPLLALGAAACAAGVALALGWSRPAEPAAATGSSEPSASPSLPSTPGAAPPAPLARTPEPPHAASTEAPVLRPLALEPATAPHAEAPAPDAGAPAPSRARARLEVVVVPWGRVFVNDQALGAAPVSLQLRAGTHHVRAESPNGVTRKRIELRPGERRRLEFR